MLSFIESLKQIVADVQATGGAVVERSGPSSDLLRRLKEYAVRRMGETKPGIVSKPVQKPVGKLTLFQGISQVLSHRKTT